MTDINDNIKEEPEKEIEIKILNVIKTYGNYEKINYIARVEYDYGDHHSYYTPVKIISNKKEMQRQLLNLQEEIGRG